MYMIYVCVCIYIYIYIYIYARIYMYIRCMYILFAHNFSKHIFIFDIITISYTHVPMFTFLHIET